MNFILNYFKHIVFSRPNSLMLLRGLVCLGVICYHVSYPGVATVPIFGINPMIFFNANGYACIWVFFILSGYQTGKSFFNQKYRLNICGVWHYVTKRVVRIVPLYYIAFALSLFLFGLTHTYQSVIHNYLTFTAIGRNVDFATGHLWYVSEQLYFYLLAPLVIFVLLFFRKKIHYLTPLLLIVLAGFIIRLVYYRFWYPINEYYYVKDFYPSFFVNIDLFLFGMALNIPVKELTNKLNVYRVGFQILHILAIVFFIVWAYFANWIAYTMITNYTDVAMYQIIILPALTTIIIGFFVIISEIKQNSITNTEPQKYKFNPFFIIESIGLLSYEIYLFHPILMYKMLWYCPQDYCSIREFIYKFMSVLVTALLVSIFFANLSKIVVRGIFNFKTKLLFILSQL
jgi:peptidoglycan/LPS O-acetylase OafA/YrhL